MKEHIETQPLKIGLGQTVITPQHNVQMYGFARSQVSTGVHDDLYAKSIAIENTDGTQAIMLVLSLCGITSEFIKILRDGIQDQTGVPENHILISCTHTHAGPLLGSSNIGSVGPGDNLYPPFFTERAIASCVEAWENRVPARVGFGTTEVFELGRNRRKLLYGGLHPDPEVVIMKIEDADGKLMGVAYNYGCHPSTLDWQNTLFSEDWPYYANEGIKQELGEDIWTAYFQGAEGDINTGYESELSAVGVDMPIRNYRYIEKKGAQMSDVVLKALPDIATSGSQVVRAASGVFDYPLRQHIPYTIGEADKNKAVAEKMLAEMEKKPHYQGTRKLDKFRRDVFTATLYADVARWFDSTEDPAATKPIEQQALRIGDTALITIPGEVFSEIGLRIKRESPGKTTFVIGLACGHAGYMPSGKEFLEGDYEVDGWCAFSPEVENVCVESSVEMIRRVME